MEGTTTTSGTLFACVAFEGVAAVPWGNAVVFMKGHITSPTINTDIYTAPKYKEGVLVGLGTLLEVALVDE